MYVTKTFFHMTSVQPVKYANLAGVELFSLCKHFSLFQYANTAAGG